MAIQKDSSQGWTVVARRVGDGVCIGEDVSVWVERIDAAKVHIRIEAPNSMPVHRGEVAAAIRRVAESHPPKPKDS